MHLIILDFAANKRPLIPSLIIVSVTLVDSRRYKFLLPAFSRAEAKEVVLNHLNARKGANRITRDMVLRIRGNMFDAEKWNTIEQPAKIADGTVSTVSMALTMIAA